MRPTTTRRTTGRRDRSRATVARGGRGGKGLAGRRAGASVLLLIRQPRARSIQLQNSACYHSALSMRVGRRYVISGRVQGVGFRYFAADAAAREGLHGWVRNLPDGRVEISAEGDVEAVDRFERSVRQGPRGSRVERVDVDHVPPTGMTGG